MPRETTIVGKIGWYNAIEAVEKIIETGEIERFTMNDVDRLTKAASTLFSKMKEANTYAYNRRA